MNSDRSHTPNENNHSSKEWSRNGSSLTADLHDLKFCRNDKFSTTSTTHLTNVIPHFDLSPVKKNSLSDHELAWGLTAGHLSSKSSRNGEFITDSSKRLFKVIVHLRLEVKGHLREVRSHECCTTRVSFRQ